MNEAKLDELRALYSALNLTYPLQSATDFMAGFMVGALLGIRGPDEARGVLSGVYTAYCTPFGLEPELMEAQWTSVADVLRERVREAA